MENLEKIKILIVEDDLLIAENLKEILQDFGYSVSEPCSTKKEAFEMLASEYFDLAILDINLNGNDHGIDIGKLIDSKYKFPFIFLTAFADNKTIFSAAETKPSAYLVKPVSSINIFSSIQLALHNFKDRQDNITVLNKGPEKDFFIKVGNKISKVNWDEVISINAGKNYVTIKIGKSNYPDYPLRSSLTQVVNDLIPYEMRAYFVQINRSQYFNIHFFKEINKEMILTDFGNFELGDKFKKELKTKLNVIV